MLTEQSAYTNRWRQVSPIAKGSFTLCGMVAACAAGSPRTALLITLILAAAAIIGAGIPPFRYLRVAALPLLFLLASTLSLVITVDSGISGDGLTLHLAESELPHVAQACCRSLTCLAALLFLALTTPLPDIIWLLRRCRFPETLLDLMTLSYRTLFVLSEAVHNTMTAQSARLGYVTYPVAMRSLGTLVGNLIVQVWQRSLALHLAAQARNNDGALRFLEISYTNSRQNITLAAAAGVAMVALTLILP